MTTTALRLLPLTTTTLDAVAFDPVTWAGIRGFNLGSCVKLISTVAQQTREMRGTAPAQPPWCGYLALLADGLIVGTCAYKAPPTTAGEVEIAYFTFPPYENRGIASAMAAELVRLAWEAPQVRRVTAHTLPEQNASTRILQRLHFRCLRTIQDPEDGPIWRWALDRQG
jgi:RimJ/RimL family protein N-acetyltransferase